MLNMLTIWHKKNTGKKYFRLAFQRTCFVESNCLKIVVARTGFRLRLSTK